jgi:hypothetical protein
MNIVRHLSIEINNDCDLGEFHKGYCPNRHPERYLFGDKNTPVTDQLIIDFWYWCRFGHNFRGVVNWNGYNEPTLVLPRILLVMEEIKKKDQYQPFQIVTNKNNLQLPQFDIVKRSRYGDSNESRYGDIGRSKLDNRLASIRGEGKPYGEMRTFGRCIRGSGYGVEIDYYGNWNLCCNDWRCEESIGNIWSGDWDDLFAIWKEKCLRPQWDSRETYEQMPRLCRSCLDVNPMLASMGAII